MNIRKFCVFLHVHDRTKLCGPITLSETKPRTRTTHPYKTILTRNTSFAQIEHAKKRKIHHRLENRDRHEKRFSSRARGFSFVPHSWDLLTALGRLLRKIFTRESARFSNPAQWRRLAARQTQRAETTRVSYFERESARRIIYGENKSSGRIRTRRRYITIRREKLQK